MIAEVAGPVVLGAGVQERAWWYDSTSGLLHVRTPGGVMPSSSLEGVVATGSGIEMAADGGRVDGLNVIGWGMTSLASQAYCIRLSPRDGERVVVSDCEASYSSSHVLGQWSSIGGMVTFTRCAGSFGLGDNLGAPTVFNAYGDRGEHRVIFDRCEVGREPCHGTGSGHAEAGGSSGARGLTLGDIGLAVTRGCTVRNERFGCANPSAFNDTPRASVLEDLRVFMVDELFEGGVDAGSGLSLAPSNTGG